MLTAPSYDTMHVRSVSPGCSVPKTFTPTADDALTLPRTACFGRDAYTRHGVMQLASHGRELRAQLQPLSR